MKCDCSVTDYDGPKAYCTEIRKARVQHKCCECRKPILPGKEYEVASGIDADGDPFRYKTCLPCMRIRDHYCPHGFLFGDLRENLLGCLGFDYLEVPKDDE
jgi:hypothetical protein